MSRDNQAPAGEENKPQARRLAEQALEAIRAGDAEASDRLFAEAERLDPQAVAEVLEEDASTARLRPAAPAATHDLPSNQGDAGPTGRTAIPGAGFHTWAATGRAGASPTKPAHPTKVEIALEVNGEPHRLAIDTRTTLLDALRDTLGLTGTKKGCALGQCGACTVLMDGRRINACLTLAVLADGHPITTIEGLSEDGELHPVQAAFIAHDAFQCGYCTPGQIMSAVGMLTEHRGQDDDDIREQMSGNICRCGAYANIVDAVRAARAEEEV
jgi:xanthine dehydrogenase YagT iron-sulfur-binding subunit